MQVMPLVVGVEAALPATWHCQQLDLGVVPIQACHPCTLPSPSPPWMVPPNASCELVLSLYRTIRRLHWLMNIIMGWT